MMKKSLRGDYLQKRMQLSEEEWNDLSIKMVENFKTIQLPPIEYLLSYYPLLDRKEFDISLCDQLIQNKHSSVKIGWPRIESDMQNMESFQVSGDGLYAKNKFNILEPINGEWIPPELIDLAFVPLVAFDRQGFRIGYGKGFYDRYLPRCRPSILKIGFSYFEPVELIRDVNEFDVPLSLCITPSGIYEF